MCGIACYFGNNKDDGLKFGNNARSLLQHRGPDDNGIYNDDNVTLAHTRLSILELSALGHQPMVSSCGRYVIAYNGEIYNHLELRKKYLQKHVFRGHSDTETIIELFRVQKEKMLADMVGMWALIIYDKEEKKIFISRSRFGQKPLYVRRNGNSWLFSSEIKPLLLENEHPAYDATALVEYMALGNYGHLGVHTFFKYIHHFPEGSYCWLGHGQNSIEGIKFWELPDINEKDKIPFDKSVQKGLHDCIVEAVLSQTLSDVPIGITLSGGVDSSIIAGILATYYDKDIHIFTAQSLNSKYDETIYVDAIINKFNKNNFIVHRKNLKGLTIKDNLNKYIEIQEEPFGDPSIIAHGFLMEMAANANIKVILNGQGADELFFGYNNMLRIILSKQLSSMQLHKAYDNLTLLKLGNKYLLKTLLGYIFPSLAYNLRTKSRIKRRGILEPVLLKQVNNDIINIYKYNTTNNVWRESMYGVHIPHLVHYDDRNAMAYSIEGRMPFLDHRIAEYVARIRPDEFLKNGLRKYILRETCKEYIPDIIYNRTDKIGFYTPLISALKKDKAWVKEQLAITKVLNKSYNHELLNKFELNNMNMEDALAIWKCLSLNIWMEKYNIEN